MWPKPHLGEMKPKPVLKYRASENVITLPGKPSWETCQWVLQANQHA